MIRIKREDNELDHQRKRKLTNKTSGSLLNNFHTKWSGHMRFITITFDGNVFGWIKAFVCTTTVHTFYIGLRWTLIASYGQYWNESTINADIAFLVIYCIENRSKNCIVLLMTTPIMGSRTQHCIFTYHLLCRKSINWLEKCTLYSLPWFKIFYFFYSNDKNRLKFVWICRKKINKIKTQANCYSVMLSQQAI